MAVDTKTTALARAAMMVALEAYAHDTDNINVLKIYDGTVPATSNANLTAAGGPGVANVMLVSFDMHDHPSFTVATNVLTAETIVDAVAAATGTATFFRIYLHDGAEVLDVSSTGVIWQGTVGTATSDLILNSTAIVTGATVSITALTYTLPE